MEREKTNQVSTERKKQLPKYEPPKVVSLTKSQILEELGPARASYGDTNFEFGL